MDHLQIQAQIDKMPALMAAKGLIKPVASFEIESNVGLCVCLRWQRAERLFDNQYEWCRGEDPGQIIEDALAYIDALPSQEERHRAVFLELAGKAADYAAVHLPDDEIAAEVRATIVSGMQRISENIITDQRAS